MGTTPRSERCLPQLPTHTVASALWPVAPPSVLHMPGKERRVPPTVMHAIPTGYHQGMLAMATTLTPVIRGAWHCRLSPTRDSPAPTARRTRGRTQISRAGATGWAWPSPRIRILATTFRSQRDQAMENLGRVTTIMARSALDQYRVLPSHSRV